MADTLGRTLANGSLPDEQDLAIFYDLDRLDRVVADLRASFPTSTLHTVAVKANPLVPILRRIAEVGLGLEVASMGEVAIALAAGVEAHAIVYDSPAKTHREIARALDLGITLNANSLAEIDRIASLRTSHPDHGPIGLRLNPSIGVGGIGATSTSISGSKFGVDLHRRRDDLQELLDAERWITGIHLHIGSQGMAVGQLAEGVRRVADFRLASAPHIERVNIGGGLPVAYRATDLAPGFATYADALRRSSPSLFTDDLHLTTEFGRAVHANNGWVASRIEYVIDDGDRTVITQVGADMFLRLAYRPDDWHHDLSVVSPSGRIRRGEGRPTNVAGPLCFAGDYLGRSVMLPSDTRPGDHLLVHDAGAYCFSMWSNYNSRRFPCVLAYDGVEQPPYLLRAAQTEEQIVAFWGGG